MIGTKINNLTVVKDLGQIPYKTSTGFSRKRHRVIVRCVCGKEKEVSYSEMKCRQFVSCGCMNNRNMKHGLRHSKVYEVYSGMMQRCHNEYNKSYHRYGGRGVVVCDEWRNDFSTFYGWALANGWKNNLQLDRIDNNGNYEPLNCRFVTAGVNANNRSNTVMLEFNGRVQSAADWSNELGINYSTLKWRYRQGMPVEKILAI